MHLHSFPIVQQNRKKLMKSKKNGTQLSNTKILLLKNIELNLYKTASSMEEYADISTLKPRMVEAVKRLIHLAKDQANI